MRSAAKKTKKAKKTTTRSVPGAAPLGAGGAGYSTRTLLEKLGIKPGARIRIEGAPEGYMALLGPLPPGVTSVKATAVADFVHLFAGRRAELERDLKQARAALAPDGMIWISWPKKSSGIASDVTEGVVRALALGNGLVDVKVAAVTDVWSGLKLVIPLKDRRP